MILNDFVEKSRAVHGSKYDYSKVVWTSSKDKVELVCPEHGSFWQKAYNHYYCKSGCPKCSGCHRYSTEEYIREAAKLHDGWYSYEKTIYAGAKKKLIVTCPEHGDFDIEASSHINGRGANGKTGSGCFKCMCDQFASERAGTKDEFIAKAIEVHGDRYDYSNVAYLHTHAKVAIRCKEHGVFLQQPANHLSGNGCPSCADYGYRQTKPGYLYVLMSENIIKVGITNRHPSNRIWEIEQDSGFKFKCIYKQKFSDGSRPLALETLLLQELAAVYQRPTEIFDGSTECFLDVNVDNLLNRIAALTATTILPQRTKE